MYRVFHCRILLSLHLTTQRSYCFRASRYCDKRSFDTNPIFIIWTWYFFFFAFVTSRLLMTVPLIDIEEFVETTIVLKKDKKNELGISVVGGSDTYLVGSPLLNYFYIGKESSIHAHITIALFWRMVRKFVIVGIMLNTPKKCVLRL